MNQNAFISRNVLLHDNHGIIHRQSRVKAMLMITNH